MSNQPNIPEIQKIIREMQQNTIDCRKANDSFSQKGADIVQNGVDDKMRSKGWPVSSDKITKSKLL